MMIARETGEAVVVVEPYRLLAFAARDVAHRADVGTDAALHASLFHYMESLAGDEHMLEESTYYVGEEPRKRTFRQMADAHRLQLKVGSETFVECVDRLSDAVACRADSKTERFAVKRTLFATGLQSQSADERAHQSWHSPAMNGENETKPFTFFQGKRLDVFIG